MSDLISRTDLLERLCEGCELFHRNGEQVCLSKCEEYHWIASVPSIQPEREKGEWIPRFDRWGDIVTTVCGYECSRCGEWNADDDKFCPNCGADMGGGTVADTN